MMNKDPVRASLLKSPPLFDSPCRVFLPPRVPPPLLLPLLRPPPTCRPHPFFSLRPARPTFPTSPEPPRNLAASITNPCPSPLPALFVPSHALLVSISGFCLSGGWWSDACKPSADGGHGLWLLPLCSQRQFLQQNRLRPGWPHRPSAAPLTTQPLIIPISLSSFDPLPLPSGTPSPPPTPLTTLPGQDAFFNYDVETMPEKYLKQRRRWMNGIVAGMNHLIFQLFVKHLHKPFIDRLLLFAVFVFQYHFAMQVPLPRHSPFWAILSPLSAPPCPFLLRSLERRRDEPLLPSPPQFLILPAFYMCATYSMLGGFTKPTEEALFYVHTLKVPNRAH